MEKNKGRKMISSFFALAQKICLSPKGDFLLKGIYKKCNMSSAVRSVSGKGNYVNLLSLGVITFHFICSLLNHDAHESEVNCVHFCFKLS